MNVTGISQVETSGLHLYNPSAMILDHMIDSTTIFVERDVVVDTNSTLMTLDSLSGESDWRSGYARASYESSTGAGAGGNYGGALCGNVQWPKPLEAVVACQWMKVVVVEEGEHCRS